MQIQARITVLKLIYLNMNWPVKVCQMTVQKKQQTIQLKVQLHIIWTADFALLLLLLFIYGLAVNKSRV